MKAEFEKIIYRIFDSKDEEDAFSIFDPLLQFVPPGHCDVSSSFRKLNAAFLIALSGESHPDFEMAINYLNERSKSSDTEKAAQFYKDGIERIHQEIGAVAEHDTDFKHRLESLSQWLDNEKEVKNTAETREKVWAVFFPEANGINEYKNERIKALRRKRSIFITQLNENPIHDPAREMLFTSNVLLTKPSTSISIDELSISDSLKNILHQHQGESQLYWFDHPIQIGVKPENNEILYGLRGLDDMVAYELKHNQRQSSGDNRLTCVLSVTVTHQSLHKIAKQYIEQELARSGGLKKLDLYIFTEADTKRIINEILAPAAEYYLKQANAQELLSVFGVDGEYGRHYSFLKSISAFWSVLIQPQIKGTFKIDLDQVFPQKELVEQTGSTAFDHFRTPLWGAKGIDIHGNAVELGLIAGALVNEKDIYKSLFTPDVTFPNGELTPAEHIFYNKLPQALSTQAEMMTRYDRIEFDGLNTCIQRIHVTGGTNGMLVDSLFRYHTFTPSFIGRAEDQAYILSAFINSNPKLAYVHKDGLIMRHDKEAFAQAAIQSSRIGTLVSDYIRLLYFSKYAKVLGVDFSRVKDSIDPFTGCFVSKIPVTVAYLRFALTAASFFKSGDDLQAKEFITIGAQRITNAIRFIQGKHSDLQQQYEKERIGWELYYNVLMALKTSIAEKDRFALDLVNAAKMIIDSCKIQS